MDQVWLDLITPDLADKLDADSLRESLNPCSPPEAASQLQDPVVFKLG